MVQGEVRVEDQSVVGSRTDVLLEALWQAGGTDLLLTVGMPPQIRVDGVLGSVAGYGQLTPFDTESLCAELLPSGKIVSWDGHKELDFSFGWRDLARVRGSAYNQRGHVAVALRMIPRSIPTPKELGLPDVLCDIVRQHQGMVIVTGPTGSGKSTTLASLLDQINAERACYILTVEDPIEFLHDHKRATISQREVGTDTASFSDALRSSLRADPDVLLVGEMRDLESIRFALTIAETGHLVLASLHTNDTAQALARIIDVFPPEQQAQVRTQLAASFTAIVYQRLIPRIGGGLVGAYEVLVGTYAVRNLIKEGKTHQLRNALVTGQKEGMVTFEASLSALVYACLLYTSDAADE